MDDQQDDHGGDQPVEDGAQGVEQGAGPLAADLELGILFPLLDRLLGGGREPGPIERRPLTDIEQRLTARIMKVLLDELDRAWRDHGAVHFTVDAWHSDPQAALGGTPQSVTNPPLDPAQAALVRQQLGGSPLEISVELATTRVRGDELFELSVGDILATETPATSPTVVRVAGVPKFHAYPGASGGNKAVRIEAAIEPPRGADGDARIS